jgi:hypothetical protein
MEGNITKKRKDGLNSFGGPPNDHYFFCYHLTVAEILSHPWVRFFFFLTPKYPH